jgi:hypothetical protein
MDEGEFEIITIRPRWSLINLVSPGSEKTKRESILYQLNGQYIKQGWLFEGDIVWGKNCEFAVIRLKTPSLS